MANSHQKTYDGLKVFSATMLVEREILGDRITEWLAANKKEIEVVETVLMQSSDQQFHCISITIFFIGKPIWNSPPFQRRDRT